MLQPVMKQSTRQMLEHRLNNPRLSRDQRDLIQERLTPPDVPEWCRHIWSRCISLLAGAAEPEWVDVDAWARRMRYDPSPWEAETLLLMARAFRKACEPVDVAER